MPRRIAGPQAKAGDKALSTGSADSHQATLLWRRKPRSGIENNDIMQAPRRIAGPQAKAGSKAPGASAADSHQATFVWRIEHFGRLKDVLKKRNITGLCVKSQGFLVGGYTCRLIIYPRGGRTYPFKRHSLMHLIGKAAYHGHTSTCCLHVLLKRA